MSWPAAVGAAAGQRGLGLCWCRRELQTRWWWRGVRACTDNSWSLRACDPKSLWQVQCGGRQQQRRHVAGPLLRHILAPSDPRSMKVAVEHAASPRQRPLKGPADHTENRRWKWHW